MITLLGRIPLSVRRTLFLLAVAAIAFVSLWSRGNIDEHVPETVQKRDYLIHAGCYLVLVSLALWSFGRAARAWRSRFTAAAACALYGLVLEFLQLLPIVGRSCSVQDILDNLLGAVVGALLLPVSLYPDSKGESPHER